VEVEFVIRRVFDLDTVSQSFSAHLAIIMRWKMPPGETQRCTTDTKLWIPKWKPRYRIKFVLDEHKEVNYDVKEEHGTQFVVAEAHHRVLVHVGFALKSFPHDTEDLNLELENVEGTDVVMWVPSRKGPTVQVNMNQCYLDDFELSTFPYTWRLYTSAQSQSQKKQMCCLQVKLKVTRNATYYVVNVAGILMVLGSLVLCAWGIHPADIEVRFQVDFTLILSVIAYKLTLSTMLPRLNYMTMLDTYVYCGFVLITLATVSHAVIPRVYVDKVDASQLTLAPTYSPNEVSLINADMNSFYASMAAWVIFNLGFALYFVWSRHREHTIFVHNSQQEQLAFDADAGSIGHQVSRCASSKSEAKG